MLEARGDLEPGSPEAEAFVEAYLKDVTMHEVGHTLGLRHNFRASRVYTRAAARRPGVHARERHHRLGDGVRADQPERADEPRERYGTPFNDTLGPYDYWAIEYAYKPLPSGLSAADETAALEKIAARSAEPLLAYGTDEDNFLGVDPETLQFDLGSDVDRLRQEADRDRAGPAQAPGDARRCAPDQDYNVLKRSVSYALRDVARAASVLSRQIGGVRTVRDAPGTGRDPLTPVPVGRAARGARPHHRQPALGRQLPRLAGAAAQARHRLQRARARRSSAARARPQTDYSPSEQVLGLQRSLLAVLMSDTVATRLLESSEKAPSGAGRACACPSCTAG